MVESAWQKFRKFCSTNFQNLLVFGPLLRCVLNQEARTMWAAEWLTGNILWRKKLSRKSTVRKIWVLEKKLQIWISKLKKFFHDCTACHKFTRPDICLLCLTIQVLYTCKIFLRFLYNSTCNGQKQFSEFTSGRSQNAKKWDKRSHYPRSRRRRSMKFWGYKIPVESHTDTKNGENPYTNTRAACKQT